MASYAVSVPEVGSSDSVRMSRLDDELLLAEAGVPADAVLPDMAAGPAAELLPGAEPLLAQADAATTSVARRERRQRVGDMANSVKGPGTTCRI